MRLKLCYIWVEKYRNFDNAGFNFASDIKYSYDSTKRELSRKKLIKLPSNFFGANISDVAGLIGKNGSGKSNILELVCKLLKGGKTSINSDFIVIVNHLGRPVCFHNVSGVKQLRANFKLIQQPYDGNIDPLKVVYFSNVFDGRINKFHRDVADISNNYRYPRERYTRIGNKVSDFSKQFQFIDNELFDLLKISEPDTIRITTKPTYWNLENYRTQNQYYGTASEELVKLHHDIILRFSELLDGKKLNYMLVYSYFSESIKLLNQQDSKDNPIKKLNNKLADFNSELKGKRITKIIDWLLELTKEHSIYLLEQKKVSRNKSAEKFYQQVKALHDLNYIADNIKIVAKREGSRSRKTEHFFIPYSKQLKRNIKLYVDLFDGNNYFNVDWSGISSGHKAYLNIFSLLHFELKRIRRENILVCIDEGDLYLHPQWQIEFFDRLITILPEIYSGNIQIVLTSHSPFLLSDLPKQNVTIVDEDHDGGSIDGISLEKETFAGNLYSLYSEPFFLGNQRTSVFAMKKIQMLLDKIDKVKKKELAREIDPLIHEINFIGDEVIKRHLLNKLKND